MFNIAVPGAYELPKGQGWAAHIHLATYNISRVITLLMHLLTLIARSLGGCSNCG